MFSCFKNRLTLIKEQNGIINLRLPENELEIFTSYHSTQRWEIDQQNLINHIYVFQIFQLYIKYLNYTLNI